MTIAVRRPPALDPSAVGDAPAGKVCYACGVCRGRQPAMDKAWANFKHYS